MITLTQSPSTLNKAFGINAVTLTGIDPKEKYVLKIITADDTLSTQVQFPNQLGNAIFDIQKVLQNKIESSRVGFEDANGIVSTTEEWFDYQLQFAAEDISGVIGTFTTSPTFTVYGGVKPYYQIGVNESSYLGSSIQGDTLTDRKPDIALKTPVRPSTVNGSDLVYSHTIRPDSAHTLSIYSKNTLKKAKISFFNSSRTLISTTEIQTTHSGKFLTIGVGTDQLNIPSGTRYYWVELLNNTGNARGQWKAHFFSLLPLECNDFNLVQFSWLNGEGFRDYYQFTKKTTKNTTVSRETYRKSLIDYNASSLQVLQGDRGEKVFSQKIQETFECLSDYLSDEDAEYLEGIIKSPDVRVNLGDGFEPVILLTDNFSSRSFRTDRLFQMSISFKLANNIKSNRG